MTIKWNPPRITSSLLNLANIFEISYVPIYKYLERERNTNSRVPQGVYPKLKLQAVAYPGYVLGEVPHARLWREPAGGCSGAGCAPAMPENLGNVE